MTNRDAVRRRDFLKTTGVLTGLLATGSPWALLAPSRAWAVDLTAFTTIEGEVLMAMARTIAPHDKLEDAAYAIVIQAVDGEAGKDASFLKLARDGVASLGSGFARAPEAERVESLKKIESGAFFQTMRVKTLQVLYSTPLAYAHFGYEGEAFSKGGYLYRGFNDLRWLPEVPLKDSGPVPVSG